MFGTKYFQKETMVFVITVAAEFLDLVLLDINAMVKILIVEFEISLFTFLMHHQMYLMKLLFQMNSFFQVCKDNG